MSKPKFDYDIKQISIFEIEAEITAEADETLFMKFFKTATILSKRKLGAKTNPYDKLPYAKDMPLPLPVSQYNRFKVAYRKTINELENDLRAKYSLDLTFIDYQFNKVIMQFNHNTNKWELYINMLITFKKNTGAT